ncbi:hypothetical protein DPEC_G00070600 [Dallia pectoralis]|uniref:Uncharacterized protein n=1 Tax=Dallia pectoralis TaxID=75939 RepID=A0ACC2H2N3_DALPE|nr:hypothetical protein DPEC_G00070600 [Dallia pectoralis]
MVGRYRGFTALLKEQVSEAHTDGRVLIYVDHLKVVKADLEIHIRDLLDLDVPVWVVKPFQADVVHWEPYRSIS